MVELDLDQLAGQARLPGSRMVPREHALRTCLALKLWSIRRRSDIMVLASDEGLALFSGLNTIPKKSFLSECASRISRQETCRLLAAWHEQLSGLKLFDGESFDLDFHSVPHYGEDPIIERHYGSSRSRRQPSILVCLARDASGRAFCYSNADIRKGEEKDEVLRFIDFWRDQYGKNPAELVFDSRFTTQEKLLEVDDLDIRFLTLRRRSRNLLADLASLAPSAWQRVDLDVPSRKYRTPRVYEQTVTLRRRGFRQLAILDLGHDQPTILLTNDRESSAKHLITRYAQRMVIENAISDAVRFFHMDALSSVVGLKADFDMALLVVASGMYRLLGRRLRGYSDAHARRMFRDLIDMPADVSVTPTEVVVRFHRRSHLPILLASGLFEKPVPVPWWEGRPLRLSTNTGPAAPR